MYRFAVAAAFVVATATATTASAGTYLGLGIGTGGSVNKDLENRVGMQQDGRSGRLMLGYSFGRIAVEGMGTSYDLENSSMTTSYNIKQAAIAGKYSLPLGDNFEAFGRLGLVRTWLSGDGDFAGNGWLLGAGFEYRIKPLLAGASIFVDYNRTTTTLDDGTGAYMYKAAPSFWTLGATLSF
jgi:hypothetical protein